MFTVRKSVLNQNVCKDVCAVEVNDVLQIDVPKINFVRTQKCSLRPYVVNCVSIENKSSSSLFPLLCPKSTSTTMLLASYVIFFVPMFLNMCCSLLCNKLFSVCSSCYHNMQRGFQNYFNTFKLFHFLTIIFNLIYTTLGFLGVLNNFNISFYIIIAIWIFTSIFKHELIQSETSPMKQKILSKLISIY